jgi:predicted metal-binding protein
MIPWEIGSIFICNKCGAKFNEPNMAEEIKSEIRKSQKAAETSSKIRVITSGCLGVCYPEKQTFSFMPVEGKTEMYTSALNKETIMADIAELLDKKMKL